MDEKDKKILEVLKDNSSAPTRDIAKQTLIPITTVHKRIKKLRKKMLVIDYNPEVVKELIRKKIPCLYGDVDDIEVIDMLNLKEIKMLISTVPDKFDNLMLIKKTKAAITDNTVTINLVIPALLIKLMPKSEIKTNVNMVETPAPKNPP